eukprot:m.595058 g.595058  ORF g.595058 m.595058 type:complete len:717 (+) comp22399_c1_seq32:320-2470(+)
MGFGSAGSNLLMKKSMPVIDFKNEHSACYWQNRKLVIEANGVSHRFMASLPSQYQRIMALHHHKGVSISSDSAHFLSDGYVTYFLKMLSGWKIYIDEPEMYAKAGVELPGKCSRPQHIEVIGEGTYPPKNNYDLFKARKSFLEHTEHSDAKGFVMPDCIMRLIFQKLQCKSISVLVPPAEFDAAAAEKVRQGHDVIVVSRDADIPLHPWCYSAKGGRIFFPHTGNSTLLCIDRKSKLLILSSHFGDDREFSQTDNSIIRVYEVMLLLCALHLPHDYHYIPSETATYGFSNATGIGWRTVLPLIRKLAPMVKQKEHDLSQLSNQNIIHSISGEIHSVGKGFPARATAAALQFLNQPHASNTNTNARDSISVYKYVGTCSKVCDNRRKLFSVNTERLDWVRMRSPPKIMTRHIIRHIEICMYADNGAAEKTYRAFDEFMDLIPRIHEIPEESFECASLGLASDPYEREKLPHDNALMAIRAKSPQSYGVKGKEKTEHREDSHYKPVVIVEISHVNGAIIAPPHGVSSAKDGILWSFCVCPNGMLCRHIKTMLIAMSRFKDEDYATNHTFSKYWQNKSTGKIQASGKPLRIRHAMTHKPFLSDIFGQGNVGPENILGLLPETYENDIDVETGETMESGTVMAIERARNNRRINRKRRSGSQSLEPLDSKQSKIQSMMKELTPGIDWKRLRKLCDSRFATTGIYANYHREADITDAHSAL